MLAGRTAVIIAHRLSTVEIADRVLVLDHGRVVQDGPPGALLAAGEGRFAWMHQSWQAGLA
jgi:ABC-type multidrug transport system fused ATPase/permease subunit